YFSKLEEGKEISFGVRLHNGFVSGRVKKHLFIQKQHLKVVETENDIKNAIFNININCKDTPCMFATKNWNIKEDKMEEVRVVRKLEDLDGLENGMGLYIDSNLDVRVKNKNMLICYGNDLMGERKENYLEALKAMGFKFEYKPLRSLEEVVEEISNLQNRKFSTERIFNYYIDLDHNDNKYKVDYCDCYETLGAVYMTEEQARKYTNELNEIIGVGK
ncbi:MAG: hypothetical protein ACRCX2_28680, partial [Paraclostridium sp.]